MLCSDSCPLRDDDGRRVEPGVDMAMETEYNEILEQVSR